MKIAPELWTQLRAAWAATKDEPTVCGVDFGQGKTNHRQPVLRLHLSSDIGVGQLPEPVETAVAVYNAEVLQIDGGYAVDTPPMTVKGPDRVPLLMSGLTCGVPGGPSGFITAIVIDELSGQPCVLTSAHVLVSSSNPIQSDLNQPHTSVSTTRDTRVASPTRSVCDLDGIAGIASMTGERGWLPVVFGHYDPITSVKEAVLGDQLLQETQVARQSRAVVEGVGFYRINDHHEKGRLPNQWMQGFQLRPEQSSQVDEVFAQGSGALWYDPNDQSAVGLQVTTGRSPIACHISLIARRLKIRMASYDDLIEDIEALNQQMQSKPAAEFPRRTLTAPGTLSVAREVWPHLLAAVMSFPDLDRMSVTPDTEMKDIPIGVRRRLTFVIPNSPFFASTGIKLEAKDVSASNDFNDLLAYLILALSDQGYTLVP
ncbi:hypothetical protein [Tropicibacter sp. Alg240-R139]|uniref:hypothetical protein n=1 Tax=Tropicibacter sp. Alg240-R139 TaxID=2305991 RepID=UPI0013E02BE5|nr:hypothetical protein [Tropicibacter sp. Alg240-R139]